MNTYPNAFNEDIHLQETFKQLVITHNPEILIETGTFEGHTTEYLASFGLPVLSTEINQEYHDAAKIKLGKYLNLTLLCGDSENALSLNFNLIKDKKVLAFLDSHCRNDQVLERELVLLKNLPHPPILIIHDFRVPDRPFGYDMWDNHIYDYEFYKPYFDALYQNKYTYRYNREAVGRCRGVIILEPTP